MHGTRFAANNMPPPGLQARVEASLWCAMSWNESDITLSQCDLLNAARRAEKSLVNAADTSTFEQRSNASFDAKFV
jgi:hypothetical protein